MKNEVYSLFPYVGGKYHLVPQLVEKISECYDKHKIIDTYIEPCGGGGRTILNLPRRGREIYSDYDIYLSNLFWAVSNVKRCNELIQILEKIPINRDTYNGILTLYENRIILTPIQSAAFAYYLNHLSFNGRMDSFGYYDEAKEGFEQHNKDENVRVEEAYRQSIQRLPDFPERLKGIEVWNGDCRALLQKYKNHKNVLFYLDPPYFEDSYIEEQLKAADIDPLNFTFEEIQEHFYDLQPDESLRSDYASGVSLRLHVDIILLIRDCKAKVILSGYNNSLYGHLVEHNSRWQYQELKEKAVSSSTLKEKTRKNECIWTNF